jgi:hypothetical protein
VTCMSMTTGHCDQSKTKMTKTQSWVERMGEAEQVLVHQMFILRIPLLTLTQ